VGFEQEPTAATAGKILNFATFADRSTELRSKPSVQKFILYFLLFLALSSQSLFFAPLRLCVRFFCCGCGDAALTTTPLETNVSAPQRGCT
jgi:hypothetical protein